MTSIIRNCRLRRTELPLRSDISTSDLVVSGNLILNDDTRRSSRCSELGRNRAAENRMFAGLGWLLLAIWIVASGFPTVWFIRHSLSRQSDRVREPAEWPCLSIVVPARDEGHKIEAGLRSLVESDYPCFEIIAVDDRSRDETGAIMDRLATEAAGEAESSPTPAQTGSRPALHVIHITELPDGWLGKNHALQVGSKKASGDWILFTDGDVNYRCDTVRRAMGA